MTADQSPHYPSLLNNTASEGVSMGVVLFNLHRMKQSTTLASHLSTKGIRKLAQLFGSHSSNLAAQDWFSLLKIQHPELFYSLPCSFNFVQMVSYGFEAFSEEIHKKYRCKEKPQILHGKNLA